MKTIFLTFSEDMLARNLFATDFWPTLRSEMGEAQIVLLTKPTLVEYAKRLYGGEGIVVEPYVKGYVPRWIDVVFTFARRGIRSHTNIWSNMKAYARGDSPFLATYIKRIANFLFARFDWYKRFLRFLMLQLPPSARTKELFDTYKPSLMVCLSITHFDFDVILGIEAKRRGIRVVAVTRSWDNLSSHGLLRVLPERLILQNRFLEEMAYEYQGFKKGVDHIDVIGLPHYDQYLDKTLLETREEFCRRNGLDPKKKILSYLGMGTEMFFREGDIIGILDRWMNEGKIPSGTQIFYSPHPKFLSSIEQAKASKHIVLADEIRYFDSGAQDRESERKHVAKLMNAMYHADLAVMGASTTAIDSLVMGTPVICIGFDGNAKEGEMKYWLSIKRFYDCYTHFEALVDTGAFPVAHTQDQLLTYMVEGLKERRVNPVAREKVIDLLVAPFDGHAGERLGKLIAEEIRAAE